MELYAGVLGTSAPSVPKSPLQGWTPASRTSVGRIGGHSRSLSTLDGFSHFLGGGLKCFYFHPYLGK